MTTTLGDRLRSLRKERKWTLHKSCLYGDLSVSFLSDIERSRTQPSLFTLKKLAALYDTTVAYLLGEEPQMTTSPDREPTGRGISETLDALRDSIPDTEPHHFVLTMVSLAFAFDRAAEVEDALTPLMDQWLDESRERLVLDDQQREDAIAACQEAWRSTIL